MGTHGHNVVLRLVPKRDACLPATSSLVKCASLSSDRSKTRDKTDNRGRKTLLTLALVGKEEVKAVYNDKEGRNSTTTSVHVLTGEPVILGNGPLSAGDVVVPFSFPVPHDLPPSKNARYFTNMSVTASDLQLQLQYALQCRLAIRDAGVPSVQQELPFTILASSSVSIPVREPMDASATQDFRYHCWSKKGSCALRVAFQTNVVRIGSRVSAHVWLTLAPPERLRSVTLSLERTIFTNTESLHFHDGAYIVVCTTLFDRSLLRDTKEFVLQLPITGASAPQVDGTRMRLTLHPTEAFHRFSVAYKLTIECRVRSCETLRLWFPVTLIDATAS